MQRRWFFLWSLVCTAILATPRSDDTLMILCSKLTAIAEVVSAGKSVAVATAYAAAAVQERHAVQRAINEMHHPLRARSMG